MQKRNATSSDQTGTNLKVLRIKAGLKQTELAEFSGLAQTDISYWERHGLMNVSCGRVSRIAKALGCKVDDLLA